MEYEANLGKFPVFPVEFEDFLKVKFPEDKDFRGNDVRNPHFC